ncbi:MAG: tetratricopeptide repeat protein [Deltaproteobacteria bacterium]|nr:MAG: tetratricopeptide repeat protein [Deltaproteobacteria bacterium]
MKRLVRDILTPFSAADGPGSRIFPVAALLAALYILTFSLQDYDTFWHLAYGRAMIETGTFINHEIFSYTAQGKNLGSHSQLAQVLLYLLWVAGGANLLLAFKLAVVAVVFGLIVLTARLGGVGATGGATLALAVLVVGMGRVVERPEIFSILLQALLLWLLFRARSAGYPHRWLWALPLLMVLWDYLHGALYGLAVLCAFLGAEGVRQLVLPRLGFSAPTRPEGDGGIVRLLGWGGATLGAMLVHPNGLLNYWAFWRVGQASHEYQMYGEFMPPHSEQFYPYWVFLVCALALIVLCLRHVDLTALAVMVPFLYLSLTYNRAVMAFALAAVPATAQAMARLWRWGERFRRREMAALVLAVALLGGALIYKQFYVIGSHRFGTGINDEIFPIGSIRFVQEQKLSGNMYNMDAFGGYLAFMAGPERKIFNYNQPGVFTALFDYQHNPEKRPQWQINYAFLGIPEEIPMFEADGFVPVYWEPGCALFVRDSAANARLIETFRIRYFRPRHRDAELLAFGKDARTAEPYLREVATYLAYRRDPRIAQAFARLLDESPAVKDDRHRVALLVPAMRYNSDVAALQAAYGQALFRLGEPGRAEPLFREVLAAAPDNFAARIGLGYILYDRGDFAAAQEQFTALAEAHPEAADAHYARGLAAMRLCQREQARSGFEKFLELAPASPYAAKAKAFLASLATGCGS